MSEHVLYNRIGVAYDNTRRADPFIARQLAAHFTPNDKNESIDIACGTGNYTVMIAELVGGRWTGVDHSTRMLHVATAKSPAIHWTAASVESLPFFSETFSTALCTNAIHHFPDLRKAFCEIRRVLKAGAQLVVFSATANQMRGYWLNEYFPRAMQRSIETMPEGELLNATLTNCGFLLRECIPYNIRDDLQDRFLYSGKHDPLRYLDANYRAGISTFAAQSTADEIVAGCAKLEADVRDGTFRKIADSYRNDGGDYSIWISEAVN